MYMVGGLIIGWRSVGERGDRGGNFEIFQSREIAESVSTRALWDDDLSIYC